VSFAFRNGTTALRRSPEWVGIGVGLGYGAAAITLRYIAETLTETPKSDVEVPPDAPTWLGDVYSLVVKGELRSAVDILFGHVDDLLLAGKFGRCNEFLQTIDLKRLDTNLIVSLLSMTRAAADLLPYRRALLDRARTVLAEKAPGRVDRLLHGL
jgi:hypothetical protein